MKKKARGRKTRRGAARSRRRANGEPRLIVLGPQTVDPTLPSVCEELDAEGVLSDEAPIATVTAGWQEREGEVERMRTDLGHPTVDLGLYRRAEEVAAADPELAAGHSDAQSRLKELRRAYNRRLAAAMSTWADIAAMVGDASILGPEAEDVLAHVRRLDARHLARVAEIRGEYESRLKPQERDEVVRHRREIEALLADTEVVAIAGGHVATLLNRLRLFDVPGLLGGRTLVAWSAGAMVLTRRIALFHDSPPWGPGNAEVFENGIGLAEGIVFFPHASRRLDLADLERTGRLASRFAPDACVLLDPGSRIERVGEEWTVATRVDSLRTDGTRQPFDSRAA